jgi:transcription-repair coupling factor (superfamily II helicase)
MQAIGFSLYMEMLEHAVKALQSGKEPALTQPLHTGAEIDLHIAALIPENYLPDVHTRLVFYKRIANANSKEVLHELQVEMIDRFGLLPEATKNLFGITELKLKAQVLGIKKIDAGPQGGRIEFNEQPNIDPMAIIQLIQKYPQLYKLDGPNRLRFNLMQQTAVERLQNCVNLFGKLTQK